MTDEQQPNTKETDKTTATDEQDTQELTVTVSDNAQKLIAQHIRQLKKLNKD